MPRLELILLPLASAGGYNALSFLFFSSGPPTGSSAPPSMRCGKCRQSMATSVASSSQHENPQTEPSGVQAAIPLSFCGDWPDGRPVQPSESGRIVAFPRVGGPDETNRKDSRSAKVGGIQPLDEPALPLVPGAEGGEEAGELRCLSALPGTLA